MRLGWFTVLFIFFISCGNYLTKAPSFQMMSSWVTLRFHFGATVVQWLRLTSQVPRAACTALQPLKTALLLRSIALWGCWNDVIFKLKLRKHSETIDLLCLTSVTPIVMARFCFLRETLDFTLWLLTGRTTHAKILPLTPALPCCTQIWWDVGTALCTHFTKKLRLPFCQVWLQHLVIFLI
jgi:hypothetical protein